MDQGRAACDEVGLSQDENTIARKGGLCVGDGMAKFFIHRKQSGSCLEPLRFRLVKLWVSQIASCLWREKRSDSLAESLRSWDGFLGLMELWVSQIAAWAMELRWFWLLWRRKRSDSWVESFRFGSAELWVSRIARIARHDQILSDLVRFAWELPIFLLIDLFFPICVSHLYGE